MDKRLTKLITSILLIFCMFFTGYAIVFANNYSSSQNTINFYPFNSWAVNTGCKYNFIFLENNQRETTRFEIANIIYNIAPLKNGKSNNISFSDIENLSNEEQDIVKIVSNFGIIKGYDDGTFKPHKNVTRAEFVVMLDRAKLIDNKTTNNNIMIFSDSVNHWAEESILKSANIGIITGKGENKFCPEDTITPQEIFIILDRLVENKTITEKELLNTMLDTFKCKIYDDTEKYMVEVIYSNFDQVQNDIKHRWPYNVWNTYYTWEDWDSSATYNDLLYALYLASTGDLNIKDEELTYFETRILSEGINLNPNKKSSVAKLKGNMELATWEDLLYALYTQSGCGSLENFITDEYYRRHFNELSFSNTKQLIDEDKAVLWALSYDYTKMLENNNMYFNMNSKLNKFVLNYMILKCQDVHKPFHNEFGMNSSSRAFFASLVDPEATNYSGYDNIKLETDKSKLPQNYNIFPYIVKGVPKEVYEIEGIRQICSRDYQMGDNQDADTLYCNPLLCYSGFSHQYSRLIENTYDFYDLILNVDYRTINPATFADKVTTYAYTSEDLALKYAQYVIDNKIILKGKGCAIPGTKSIAGPLGYVRVMIEFEILSANEKVDLLYGDFINPHMGYYDRYAPEHIPVVYQNNKYFLYFDTQVSGSLMFTGNDYTGVGNYRVMPNAIIRDIYLKDDSIHTLY